MTKGGIQIHIHSGFQPSAEGVALFSQRFASLHIGLNYYALSGLFFNCYAWYTPNHVSGITINN